MKYKITGGLILAAVILWETMITRSPHWGFDGFGFFAWYGFLSCVVLVIISKLIGKWLQRKDSYYHD